MPLDGTLIAPAADACLLPRSATPYMRALSAAMRPTSEILAAIDRVADIHRDMPDAAIPFLVWEFGLEPVMPWLTDPRRALREGRAWQRIRGTPAAIEQALSWRNVPLVRIEEDAADTWWDLFQLQLTANHITTRDLAALVALTRLSRAAHTDVIRIYNASGDDRVLELNGHGAINGDGLFNDWSGQWIRPDWPKVALRDTERAAVSGLASGLVARDAARERLADEIELYPAFAINRDDINGGLGIGASLVAGGEHETLADMLVVGGTDEIPDLEMPDHALGDGGWLSVSELLMHEVSAGAVTMVYDPSLAAAIVETLHDSAAMPPLTASSSLHEATASKLLMSGDITDAELPDTEIGDDWLLAWL